MPYQILFTDYVNKLGIVVEDGSINNETSVKLPGKNTTSYGTIIAENFLHLLENFASPTAPSTPVEGQVWYDSSPDKEQLMVYNGANWAPVNGVNKSESAPAIKQEGDLWIDRENLQLYMYTDAGGWILIGPEFSDGVVTGATPKVLSGIDDKNYNVLQIDINGVPSVIISMKEFTPKLKIDGFVTIKPGLNLTSKILPGQSEAKYYGLAEKAESMQIGNETVLAGNFLRGDAISATNFQISVLNNTGILYGRNSELAIGVEGSVGVLKHNVAGSAIDVKVRNDGIFKTIARFDSSMKVGIAKDNPDAELDVNGDIQTSVPVNDLSKGKIFVNNTQDSNLFSNGSIVTAGGIGVAKSVTIGGNLYLNTNIDSQISSNKLVPNRDADELLGTEDSYLGTPSLRYNSVYSKRFYGDLTGTVTGSVTGRAGSANKLAKSSQFIFSGDVKLLNSTEIEEGVLNFTGQGEQVEFITELTAPFINSKEKIISTQPDDELILYRIRESIGLKKVSVKDLLATVPIMPIGTIIPFAGDTAPVGWILCNGQEVQTVDYQELYSLIGYKYKSVDLVKVGFFAVPDLRGRFPLGIHNMGGLSPNESIVNDPNAQILGGIGGQETVVLDETNLPDHKHDLYYNDTQFYATSQKQFEIVDDEVIDYHFYEQQTEFTGVAMKNTQGVKTDQILNTAVDVMNPFIALNYIIYAG